MSLPSLITILIADLKKAWLWNQDMLDQLKYYDGSIQHIRGIPEHLSVNIKKYLRLILYGLLRLTAARGKWIDQSQSHNVFMKGVSGKILNDIYITAWKLGLKSTYYLRTLGASQIEKSTLDAKKFGFTQKREYGFNQEVAVAARCSEAVSSGNQVQDEVSQCAISTDPECDVMSIT